MRVRVRVSGLSVADAQLRPPLRPFRLWSSLVHLLVQNKVQVVGAVAGRLFGAAGRSEEAEEQHGRSRRGPPALGAELLLRAGTTRQRLRHPP